MELPVSILHSLVWNPEQHWDHWTLAGAHKASIWSDKSWSQLETEEVVEDHRTPSATETPGWNVTGSTVRCLGLSPQERSPVLRLI
ncbi:hypothetical protein ABVT39_013699 [Epinephelus coioides]